MNYAAIIIVGFRCSDDIAQVVTCLTKIKTPDHVVHICENGGVEAFGELVAALLPLGCEEPQSVPERHVGTMLGTRCIRLADGGTKVYLHQATGNLGYAGAINAVLKFLAPDPDWDAIWILNPDTEPAADALMALKRRAAEDHYGVVGSRIVLYENNLIQMYGGRWRRWRARGLNIGFLQPADAQPDVARIEAEMEYVCGASMYVVRPFIEAVGPMEEGYFLYGEEVDWCFRRGDFKLGYAHDSVVRHFHGATIGSSYNRRTRASFSVFLDERSKMLFTRRFYPRIFPLVAINTLALTGLYLKAGAFKNFGVAIAGWFSGLRGETGLPQRFKPRSESTH